MSGQPWEKLLEFDHPTMMAYMEERGVPLEQLELMARVQLDGPMWRAVVSYANCTRIKEDISEEIEVMCGKEIPKSASITINMHTKLAFENWLQKKDGATTNNKGQLLSIKELHSIKLPELPVGKGVDGRVTGEQVKAHAESLNVQPHRPRVQRPHHYRIIEIYRQPTMDTLTICLEGMASPL